MADVPDKNTVIKSQEVNQGAFLGTRLFNEIAGMLNNILHNGGNYFVGEIVESFLTEAQMATITPNLVLADGRDVTGSAYATLTGQTTVPDLRGEFIRGLDETQTTDPDIRTLYSFQADELGNHNHDMTSTRNFQGGGSVNKLMTKSRPITPTGNNVDLATDNFGGTETRPKNYNPNFFIRIN